MRYIDFRPAGTFPPSRRIRYLALIFGTCYHGDNPVPGQSKVVIYCLISAR